MFKKSLFLALITMALGMCLTSCGEESIEEANPATIKSGELSLSLGMSREEGDAILGEGEEIPVTYGEYFGIEEGRNVTIMTGDTLVTAEMKDDVYMTYIAYTDDKAKLLCLYEEDLLSSIMVVEEVGGTPWAYDENIFCGLAKEDLEEALGVELTLYAFQFLEPNSLEIEGFAPLAQVEGTALFYFDADGTMYASDILMEEVEVDHLLALYFDVEGILLGYDISRWV